jgi:hypothetical protein
MLYGSAIPGRVCGESRRRVHRRERRRTGCQAPQDAAFISPRTGGCRDVRSSRLFSLVVRWGSPRRCRSFEWAPASTHRRQWRRPRRQAAGQSIGVEKTATGTRRPWPRTEKIRLKPSSDCSEARRTLPPATAARYAQADPYRGPRAITSGGQPSRRARCTASFPPVADQWHPLGPRGDRECGIERRQRVSFA